jgi:predicted metal-dependent peptidase
MVQRVDRFGPEDSPDFHIKGRGGTDFRPIFDWIAASGVEPKCLVLLTDLEAPFPQVAPSYPVLWVSVNNKTAPFGDTVYMEV